MKRNRFKPHSYIARRPLPEFRLWDKMQGTGTPFSFELEITARCNNNCRHCCVNLPAGDRVAQSKEMSLEEIREVVDEAASLGVLFCLLSGGEPLLRDDFRDIYLYLKKKGLLVTIFTNATLIRSKHIKLFQHYPPRHIEVSLYGVTAETYERVTRRTGSFAAFERGLRLLQKGGIPFHLKAMIMRSNVDEFPAILLDGHLRTGEPLRFDPFLHLRFDGDAGRNAEIRAERLSPGEIQTLEGADLKRFAALKKSCTRWLAENPSDAAGNGHLFYCRSGLGNFAVSYDGLFRLCTPLWHPDCIYSLRRGTLTEALQKRVPEVRTLKTGNRKILQQCLICPWINLCSWCPAHAYLETGKMDSWVEYFCRVAQERAKAVGLGCLPPGHCFSDSPAASDRNL